MKKKVLSVLLATAMVFSLAACGGSNETPATGSTESTASTESSTAPAAPVEAVKPETIKVMWDGTIFKEGDNYAEEFYAALDEALGLKIEWVRPDHSTYAKEQVGIAFNDKENLADVIILPSDLYASYAAQGNLWNMTDAWNASETANSGRLTEAAAQVIDGWYVTGPDGQEGIYGMYPARGNGTVTYVKAVDAKKAGYTQDTLPTDWAGFQKFLLDLKAATGKAPLLAPGLFNKEAPYVNYLPEFYQGAYPDFYYDASGKLVDGFAEPAMAEALDRLAWGYSNGVIDPMILENPSTSDVRNKFYAMDGTSVFNYWAGTWAYNIKSNLGKNYTDTTACTKDEYSEAWAMKPIKEVGAYMERLSPMICITSECDNPEGVFQYFIDKILDGGEVQMLWQYGVKDVHYQWNEDGKTITGLATQSTKGSEKESKTTKNLFEANLKIANFADLDPYTAADPVIDESFNLFNENSKIAPKIYSSETYRDYSSTLWTEKQTLVAAVAKGEMTGAQAIEAYREKCGAIADTILAEANAQ